MQTKRLMMVAASAALLAGMGAALAQDDTLTVSERETIAAPGVDLLLFSNWYDGLFADAKISGVEVIHHGRRTATNGDVRLEATPGQWELIGRFGERRVDVEAGVIEADLSYPDQGFDYTVRAEIDGDAVIVSVLSDDPLPAEMVGKAGFNLEFLPPAYWHEGLLADGEAMLFPRSAAGNMTRRDGGPRPDGAEADPMPFAAGRQITLAPTNPERRIAITSQTGEMAFYDGRNQASNGWYVLRETLPSDKTGTLISWRIEPSSQEGWTRDPVLTHSQVGYTPGRSKKAVLELDRAAEAPTEARILRAGADGTESVAATVPVEPWGAYLRYDYATIDLSGVTDPGLYTIEVGEMRSAPFVIGDAAYETIWHPTSDVFMPVQMDHMTVDEAYRVWHGAAHMDDALQAPVDHEHFDLYAQGPTTDTKFAPMEHIPGLNVGGWFDAGDYDIRTQSQYGAIQSLVAAREAGLPDRDTVAVDWENRWTELHVPDGQDDILQQIKHGTLQLVAQHEAIGHAIHGMVAPNLDQYTHLGDGLTKTDGLIYDRRLDEDEARPRRGTSGKLDDRWAFTSESTALNYGSAAGLASAARLLRGYDDALADKALSIAVAVFEEEAGREPLTYRHGNTTGGPIEVERFAAAAQLLASTGDKEYADRVAEWWPAASEHFSATFGIAARVIDEMDPSFTEALRGPAEDWLAELGQARAENPFGVRITRGGWAGARTVMNDAVTLHEVGKAFPDLADPEGVLAGLDFVLGRHPGHELSLVSGVGARSKEVAYGTNRADFSFIPGGIVPGVLIIKPDYPENKEDWPFFWGQNEYVIPMGPLYMELVVAAMDVTGAAVAGD